jgi:hypothetical protein
MQLCLQASGDWREDEDSRCRQNAAIGAGFLPPLPSKESPLVGAAGGSRTPVLAATLAAAAGVMH